MMVKGVYNHLDVMPGLRADCCAKTALGFVLFQLAKTGKSGRLGMWGHVNRFMECSCNQP